jgi:hypothetical protein
MEIGCFRKMAGGSGEISETIADEYMGKMGEKMI